MSATVQIGKHSMFGFLKNLWRKAPRHPVETRQSPDLVQAPVTTTSTQSFAEPPQVQRKNLVQQSINRGVELSLSKILAAFPLELQPRIRQSDVGDVTISIPLEKVLAQLSSGAVKISFGELRAAFPDVFTLENDRDRVMVVLPLNEILLRLNPALITRRRTQRKVEVPDDVSSPFEGQSQEMSFGAGEASGAAALAAPLNRRPALTPPGPAAPLRPHSSPSSAPQAPTHKITPVVERQAIAFVAPAAPPAAPVRPNLVPPSAPASAPAPALQVAPADIPGLNSALRIPIKPNGNGHHHPLGMAPAVPVAAQAPAAVPTAAPASQPAATPAPETSLIMVGLTSLAEAWPEAVRREIIQLNLIDAKVALPANSIEQALKQGRIAFSWKNIRSWIKPAILPTVSVNDAAMLEMPLKVVAPLFLARQNERAQSRPKVSVDKDIPNLFFGFPQGNGDSATTAPKPADTNYYVWDDSHDTARINEAEVKRGPTPGTKFATKYATPNEIVSRAAGLEGVAGSLIALPDGLMVASRLSADVNADTLAAFLPQIFGKVSQCTKELRMGELNNLNFTVGNVPWKIFRVNAIFFAAFGRAGEGLPTAQLAALAAELDHKPK